ncbi:MAG TPA: DUF2997 domain-containing protein [Chloroflexota bacterium]|nr:DUF2997 domain-containing protein [Chloroflexota bacterium]
MPEIEFTIDPTSGQLEMHVKGIVGSACDDVAKLARELLGEPGHEQLTQEYFATVQVRQQVRPSRPQ